VNGTIELMITSNENTRSICDDIMLSNHPIKKLKKKNNTDRIKLDNTIKKSW
jgi:hypothetical protein